MAQGSPILGIPMQQPVGTSGRESCPTNGLFESAFVVRNARVAGPCRRLKPKFQIYHELDRIRVYIRHPSLSVQVRSALAVKRQSGSHHTEHVPAVEV